MSSDGRRWGSTIAWCLRRYSWLAVVGVLAGAVTPLAVAKPTATYQAQALVVAQQLTVSARVLPQMAESVFADGAVAAAVAADPAIGPGSGPLVPDRLSVVAPQDAIVLTVQARDADPVTAARMANVAAKAFVAELDRGGAGIGDFTLQTEAIVPTVPLEQTSLSQWIALGVLAGLLVGIGLMVLVATVRRPVIAAADVMAATGTPLVGRVRLPALLAGHYPGPLGARGIANAARVLATAPPGRLLVISEPSGAALRQRVLVMLAVALATVRRVAVQAPAELVEAVDEHVARHREAGELVRPRTSEDDALLIVDGGTVLEVIDPTATDVSVVAVARVGVPRRRLRALTADYADAGLLGVILVDAPARVHRARRRPEQPAQPEQPAAEERELERA